MTIHDLDSRRQLLNLAALIHLPPPIPDNHNDLEFRCTINAHYSNPDCSGHKNLVFREGHYLRAISPERAVLEMTRRYPGAAREGFSVQVWR